MQKVKSLFTAIVISRRPFMIKNSTRCVTGGHLFLSTVRFSEDWQQGSKISWRKIRDQLEVFNRHKINNWVNVLIISISTKLQLARFLRMRRTVCSFNAGGDGWVTREEAVDWWCIVICSYCLSLKPFKLTSGTQFLHDSFLPTCQEIWGVVTKL